jgi:hypothetical protein
MEQTLTLSGIVLLIALAVRLKVTGLSRPYRGLFAYSIFVLIRNGVPPVAALFFRGWGPNGFYYSYWWAFTEVIQWLFLVILILDLCSAIFQDFPSLASFGGRIYRTALGVAIGVSLASLFLSGLPEEQARLHVLLAVQRVVLTSLMLVIVALLFSLTWFRVNVRKNTLVHAAVFFIYFFAKAGIAFILQTMGLDIRGGTNTALMLVADMCILAWIVGLRPAGEQVEVRVGHRWNPEEGERLVQQLAKLNESLANRSANPARSAGGIASEQ